MEHSQTGVGDSGKLKPSFRFFATLAGLNLIWEIGQLPFYALWHDGNWQVIGSAVAHCTTGDILKAFACTIAALTFNRWHWPLQVRQSAFFVGIFVVFWRGLHNLQRVAQHYRSHKLVLFGFDADFTTAWHRRCAAPMDRGADTCLLAQFT